MRQRESERAGPQSAKEKSASAPPRLPQSSAQSAVSKLQHTLGNAAVTSLLASGAIQAKLRVSQPGDADEVEADRVAEQVVSSPAATLHRKCAPGTSPECQEEEVEAAKGIHRKTGGGSDQRSSVADDFAQSLGSGQPLEPAVRESMETSFGHDFSGVRVHTDERAAASARSVNAQAFTLGNDVAFDTGLYAPHSTQGKRLLAHELAHVAQAAGSSHTIARQPGVAAAQDARSYVQEAIQFLQTQADTFRLDLRLKSSAFDDAGFRRRLSRLKNILDKTQSIIESDLNKDPALVRSLQSAYKDAIDAAIAFAAKHGNQTTHASFQQFADLIPDWALPQEAVEASEAELSGALRQNDRAKLAVITNPVHVAVDDLFSTQTATVTIPLPAGATVEFSSGVPAKLQHGLTNVAGTVIPKPLHLNSTITLALDLEPYGGDYGLYRFTYLERSTRRGRSEQVVLIERLGAIGVERVSTAQAAGAQKKFDGHQFARGGGWSDPQFLQVLQAVAELPDSLLSPVDGITFKRDREDPSDPKTGGKYDPDAHAITMFDVAFKDSATRFGVPGAGVSTDTVRAVAHEIGHAVDLLPLRKAWASLEQERSTLRTAFKEFESPPGSGNYSFPSDRQASWNALSARVAVAERSLTATRADSGERHQKDATGTFQMVQGGTAAGSIEFRQAAATDGAKRITEYSDKEWGEYFAEAFSLYITDPETLRRLRPHVYEFLARHHPK